MAVSVLSLLGNLRRILAAVSLLIFVSTAGAGVVEESRALIEAGSRRDAAERLRSELESLSGDEQAEALWLLATLTTDGAASGGLLERIRANHTTSRWWTRATEALMDRAILAGNLTTALAYAETLTASERLTLKRADILLGLGRAEEAGTLLEPLTRSEDPLVRRPAELRLAAAAYRDGRYADALEVAVRVSEGGADAESAGALVWAARALLARGEFGLAEEYLLTLGRDFADTAEGAIGRALADSLADRRRGTQPPAAPDSLHLDDPDDLVEPTPEDTTPSSHDGTFAVIIGRYGDRLHALRALSTLRRRGLEEAVLVREEDDHERVFRIRVGSFSNEPAAQTAQRQAEEILGVAGSVREES